MKKIILPVAFVLLATTHLWSQGKERMRFWPDEQRYISLGVLGGVFFMQDETFQEVYGKSKPFVGAEFSYRFPFQEGHGMEISIGGGMLSVKGMTSYTEEETRLRLTNFSFCLRYSYAADRITFFLGPGMDYLLYKETYAETFPVDFVDGNDTGFHIASGIYFHLTSGLSLKVSFRYRTAETSAPGFRVNLSGTEWSAGLVYRFLL